MEVGPSYLHGVQSKSMGLGSSEMFLLKRGLAYLQCKFSFTQTHLPIGHRGKVEDCMLEAFLEPFSPSLFHSLLATYKSEYFRDSSLSEAGLCELSHHKEDTPTASLPVKSSLSGF